MSKNPLAATVSSSVSYSQSTYNVLTNLTLGGHLSKLNGRATKVLLVVLTRYNWKKRHAWPSLADISHLAGISHDTAQRALNDLEQLGFLAPVKVSGKVNRYVLPSWILDLSQRNPWANQTQNCVGRETGPHANLRDVQEEVSELLEDQQQPTLEKAADVVVPNASSLQKTSSPKQGEPHPEALKIASDVYQALKDAGVKAPWRLAQYGEDRLRQVLVMLRTAKTVKNQAAWIVAALQHGWEPKPAPTQSNALEQETRAYIEKVEQAKQELKDPVALKRSRLSLVANYIKLRKPTADKISSMLERHGLTQQELDQYCSEVAL